MLNTYQNGETVYTSRFKISILFYSFIGEGSSPSFDI